MSSHNITPLTLVLAKEPIPINIIKTEQTAHNVINYEKRGHNIFIKSSDHPNSGISIVPYKYESFLVDCDIIMLRMYVWDPRNLRGSLMILG